MNTLILLLHLFNFTSIHQIEYQKHLNEARWTAVSDKKLPYVPLSEGAKGLKKVFYGYLPYWVDTLEYLYFQMKLLTHIAYFSIGITPSTGALGSIPDASRFTKIRDYAHPRGVRVNMTFTIFGSSNVSTVLNNPSARSNAIGAIKDFVTNYGIDGVNIDFEFVTSSVRDSFNKFINDLAYELWNHPDGRKELYIAMPAVPEWYPGYDYSYLSTHSDGLFIMAYDFHYSGSSVAGPVSPTVPSFFWGSYSVAKTIESYKAYGADPQKMILGVPYYGYDWPTNSSSIGSSTRGSGSAVIYKYAYQNANSYGRIWDNYSQTPWYAYYASDGWHQCWYDDSASLDLKFSMVKDSGLLGAGCWALGYDGTYMHIWHVIRKNFWLSPPLQHWVVEVNTDELNVREKPGIDFPVITTIRRGEKFVAFDYRDNWYKIYYPSGEGLYYAWVYGGDGITHRFLKGSTGDTILLITANLLNVREGPGTSYNIITQVADGQVFVADSFDGSWARIYIPNINGSLYGWISLSYVSMIYAPEDSNTYNCQVMDAAYPAVVNAGDTFTLSLEVLNKGYAPFDTLVDLKSSEGAFYNPTTWSNTHTAQVTTYQGITNQTFYVTSSLKAPFVSRDSFVTDTFQFERKGERFGPPFVVSVAVRAQKVKEKNKGHTAGIYFPRVFGHNLVLSINGKEEIYEISMYDVSGKIVFHNIFKGSGKLTLGKSLPKGIYFLVIKTRKGYIQSGKVVKIY